ncbi:uncharacterized protein LOC130648243 [Hydractinia symbiolongicarpus]|uniref:uncharacterized protein LOC130648243 n=1 Tax=Hydractinia symbiolongicarpus TaxID=13093 RepID=UPI00254A3805|nr:uncharacterized protein LOC130648243 [Hydractinia symbiolongicarpus]
MITLQAYRVNIGVFYSTFCGKTCKESKKIFGTSMINKHFNSMHAKCLLGIAILLIISSCNLNIATFQFLFLAQAGDIESNPGPGTYNVLKSVKASCHQGDIKFGNSAGSQCLCNCLFAISYSIYRRVALWTSADLDSILKKGDKIYCEQNVVGSLSILNLPTLINFDDNDFDVQMLHNATGFLHNCNERFLTPLFGSDNDVGDGFLIIVCGFTVCVVWTKKHYFLFDPHCRNSNGCISDDGTGSCVLLKFSSLFQVEKYICAIYVPLSQGTPPQYECQFIRVSMLTSQSRDSLKRKSPFLQTIHGTKRKALYHEKIKDTSKQKKSKCIANAVYRDRLKTTRKHEHIKKCKASVTYHKRTIAKSSEDRISTFKRKISDGPFYICVCCERLHYRDSVVLYDARRYSIDVESYCMLVESYDANYYVCKTCHKKLLKGETPCQASWNKLTIDIQPTQLSSLNKLERILIAKRMLFTKVIIMPKGQMAKIKGAVCNVPINVSDTAKVLPRGADSNGIITVKLKRKLCYRGHAHFQAVRPEYIQTALEFLKSNNPLYSDVIISLNNIPSDLSNVSNATSDGESYDENNENRAIDEELEENENPLNEMQAGSPDTVLVANIPHVVHDESVVIAPGEGIKPLGMLADKQCEALSFPYLFPNGQFGYNVDRDVPLSASKYFNQRLLNYKRRFASDVDYIFFAHSLLQQMQLSSQINIALKKVKGDGLTAGMLSSNFKENVNSFIAADEGFHFMHSIKGTPAYWKRFLLEILAMVKQLGLPTFFMTLSCADLRWNELVKIILKLSGGSIAEEDLKNLSYHERCDILNMDPVFMAKHFQYRVEVFFKEIIINGPLGKVEYYAIRFEFQFRGSPHIHSFLWVVGAPKLFKENKQEYIDFVDAIIKADIPTMEENTELHHLVKTFQIHAHSKSCRKYKNIPCRYSFGKFFTAKTIVAEPLPIDINEHRRSEILEHRENLLGKVKSYIDKNLNPLKVNFLDPLKEGFCQLDDIPTILAKLDLSENEYYSALAISSDNDFQLHLKRPPNSCFVNNYFIEGLMAWEANLDIQPVFNHYKAVTYMCAYFSKSEDETSEAMKHASREAKDLKKSKFELMKDIARAYSTKRECSVQEAVYHIMPELWLRKTCPGLTFANSNMPQHRYRIFLSEDEIKELPEDSIDVFKRNMIDRYLDRPDKNFRGGKYQIIDTLCYAQFLANYYVKLKPNDAQNDNQPEILVDEIMEANHSSSMLPKTVLLMSSVKETLTCRKVKAVLRMHCPKIEKHPEGFAHHHLFMYYPFRSECELRGKECGTYMEKLHEPGVLEIINRNKQVIQPYGELVETALNNLRSDLLQNPDAFAQHENDEVEQMLAATEILSNVQDNVDDDDDINSVQINENRNMSLSASSAFMNDNELNSLIRSLNNIQRLIFNVINKWARNLVKNRNAFIQHKNEPLHIFLTGKAGCGKSHLINTVYQSVTKTMSYHGKDPEKPRVLLLAPTGIAAININGNTIHSGLNIPIHVFGKTVPRLSDQKRSMLRNKLSELQLIIIDEVSMVSNILLLHIHQRLVEIFGCSTNKPFAGISIIFSGDLYQLPPIKAAPVYSSYGE